MAYHKDLSGADLHPPKVHASSHTDGTDNIQEANATQKGLMTATHAAKLDALTVDGSGNVGIAGHFNVDGIQVVSNRVTGWTAPTGTAARATFATYAAPDISTTPTEAEVQALADHVQVLSQRMKALIDDLTTHGLIGA